MTVVFTETWTGSDGSAWPAAWSTPGTNTIQSNMGRLSAPTFSATSAYAALSPTQADCEVFLNFVPDATAISVSTTFTVSIRADGAGTATVATPPTTGVNLLITSVGGSSVTRTVAGTTTFTNSGTAQGTWVAGTVYGMRIHAVGTHIQMRWWDTGSAEPGTWTLDSTNASYPTSAGSLRLAQSGSGSTIRINNVDNLTVDDLAVAAASNPLSIRSVSRVPLIRSANF